MTIHVKQHTRVINGKLVTVAAHDKGGTPKVIHHELDDEFANLESSGAFGNHQQEPKPEPSVDDEFSKLDASGAFGVEDEFDKLAGEGAFDDKPIQSNPTVEQLLAVGKEWKAEGKHRIYFNGLAKWNGGGYDGMEKGAKIWFDVTSSKWESKLMSDETFDTVKANIVKDALVSDPVPVAQAEDAKPVDSGAIPEGWTGVKGGIITNQDPVNGGIIDKNMAGKGWFAVPNMDGIPTLEGFKTQQEALQALSDAVKAKQAESGTSDTKPAGSKPEAPILKSGDKPVFDLCQSGQDLFDKDDGAKWSVVDKNSASIKVTGPEEPNGQWITKDIWDESYAPYLEAKGDHGDESGPEIGKMPDFEQLKPGMVLNTASGAHSFVVIETTPNTMWVQAQNGDVLEYSDELWNSYIGKPDKAPTLASLDDADFKPNTGKATLVHNVGDTKTINGKIYIFNENHRWELVDPNQQAAPQDSNTLDKLKALETFQGTSIDGVMVKKNSAWNNLYLVAKNDDNGKALPKKVKDAIAELHPSGYKNKKSYFIVHGDNLGKLAEILDEKKAGTLKGKPKPKPAATAKPAAPKLPASFPYVQVGPQKGSNPGGLYEDNYGKKWYIKFPATADHAQNELLASKLYKMAGIDVPKLKLVNKDGKVGIASEWQDGLSIDPDALKGGAAKAGFAADAWLANWDSAGLSFDNMPVDKDGKAIRIDVGGSLLYRAQGGEKGDAFGTTVTEIDTLRDAAKNPQTAAIFGDMSDNDIQRSLLGVLVIPDEAIRAAVSKWSPGSDADKKALADKLIARKRYLSKRFPEAEAIANPPAPDPRHLPITEDQLPKKVDFFNYNGPGKGLSSKEWKNAANQKTFDELYAFAMKGDLIAMKKYQYKVIDESTGKETGEIKTISDGHPNKDISTFYSNACSYMEAIAYPSNKAVQDWLPVDADNIQELSDAFPGYPFGTTVGDVPKAKRLGYWVSLGSIEEPDRFVPENVFNVKPETKSAASKDYDKMPQKLKNWLNAVQGSGSSNIGDKKSSNMQHQKEVVALAYQHATEFPEGTKIRRWLDMPSDMAALLETAPDGHVFQNPRSQCCSMRHDWETDSYGSGFGSSFLEIVYAKGAKGLATFGSGGFSKEQEITSLPGQRYMILEKGVVADGPKKGAKKYKLLCLPPDHTYMADIGIDA